jgi:CheY-like chemotaxis protein
MDAAPIQLLLADDDKDDCSLFEEVLRELPLSTQLSTVHNGEQLVQMLLKLATLPEALFLDLNMPRKNGLECLIEIRMHNKLQNLPVIVYSTSFEPGVIDQLYDKGANHYIRKPAEFSKLKKVIYNGIMLAINTIGSQPKKENFILQP